MKTSILISSFVTLCLLVTFAEAPRHHGEDKMSLMSTENVSIKTIKSVTMLPALVIAADLNSEANIPIPVFVAEDFGYLEFDVTKYMEADANNPDDAEVLPEATKTDFSYLKFKVNDFITNSYFNIDQKDELPVNENISTSIPEPAMYEYLRFDVNQYINSAETDVTEIGKLLLQEVKTNNSAAILVTGETPTELGYLKFDITKYYSLSNPGTDETFELPEK